MSSLHWVLNCYVFTSIMSKSFIRYMGTVC